jgi:photosystem I subunit XII
VKARPREQEFSDMSLTDSQVYIALVIALIPGILAFRLSTELYK